MIFPMPILFFLIVFQPIGEEIFFRGFLLEKIDKLAGEKMAILITALLFGWVHISYGKLYPMLMPILLGILFGFIVIRTKNLFSSITAHIAFNVTVFIMYLGFQNLNLEALIL